MPKEYVYEHEVTLRDATTSGIAYDGSYIEWACTARERMIVRIYPGVLNKRGKEVGGHDS